MDIKKAHQNWTELGEKDPMWVVLTNPDKEGGKWTEEEFFQNGRDEVAASMKFLKDAGVTLLPGRALDFGCGLGRLTQALSAYFSAVDGVDISATMIEKAQQMNRAPEKVHYHLNVKSDLSLFSSAGYDFIYSRICLQHIPPQYQVEYIAEFMRLLKPGGVAHFQTIHAVGLRAFVPEWLVERRRQMKSKGKAYIPMHGLRANRVDHAIETHGGAVKIHDVVPYVGWAHRYANDIYVVTKS